MQSEFSMNTVQNLGALESQIQQYEADIRKHISIEHQLQLYSDDLKRTISSLEFEKESLQKEHIKAMEDLKRDKSVLRDFLKTKD